MADDTTSLIEALQRGDRSAHAQLFERVYGELKVLARHQLRSRPYATLDTTELVHDAYLKLACPESLSLSGRKHFYALAAKAMRQILVDHARAHYTDKRGAGEARKVSIDDIHGLAASEVAPDRMLALDRVLDGLEAQMPRFAALVELHFFAGLDLAEVAAMEGVSERTLNRDWRRARAEVYAALYE